MPSVLGIINKPGRYSSGYHINKNNNYNSTIFKKRGTSKLTFYNK
jgi:hypothetical protein